MKKKQGIFIVGFAVLVVILAVSSIWVGDSSAKSSVRKAFFWRQMMGEDGRPLLRQYLFGRMKSRIDLAEKLNLSKEQKKQFKEFLAKERNRIAPAVAEVIAKKQALVMQVYAETPDEAALRQASAELAKAIENMAVLSLGLVREARTILTPEQLRLLSEYRESRGAALGTLVDHLRRPLNDK